MEEASRLWGEDICGSFVLGVLWLTTRQKRTVARGRGQETVAWLLWEITKSKRSNPSVLKTTTCELYLKTPFRQNDLVVREENKLSTEECESCASSSAASRTKKKNHHRYYYYYYYHSAPDPPEDFLASLSAGQISNFKISKTFR